VASNITFEKSSYLLIFARNRLLLRSPRPSSNRPIPFLPRKARPYDNKVRLVAMFGGWRRSVCKLLSVSTKTCRALVMLPLQASLTQRGKHGFFPVQDRWQSNHAREGRFDNPMTRDSLPVSREKNGRERQGERCRVRSTACSTRLGRRFLYEEVLKVWPSPARSRP
jgi:hypothetical protein